MKQIRKRITYANVMSSIAVFLVLGGATAFAATKIGTNELKGNSITTGKIKKEAVTKAKIKKGAIDSTKLADNSVTTSKIADNAVTNTKIADGAVTGNKIAGGTISRGSLGAVSKLIPQAYAYVKFDAKVEPGFTENISNGTHPATGKYCFDLAFTPVHAQATVQADGDSNDFASVNLAGLPGGIPQCPAGSDLLVEVEDAGDNPTDEEFFVVVW